MARPKLDPPRSTPTAEQITGVVRWFNDAKGYGFISPDSGSKDVFVHHTGIDGAGFKTLYENEKVAFSVVEGAKGPQAANVRVTEPSAEREEKRSA